MKKYISLFITMVLLPTITFASSGTNDLPLEVAVIMEAFVSIHMSIFVLLPLSKLISQENSKTTFWKLFAIRIAILVFFDLFITTAIAIVDFIAIFVGAFLVVPIWGAIKKQNPYNSKSSTTITNSSQTTSTETILKCAKCGGILKVEHKFCTSCGAPFEGNNVTVSSVPKVLVTPTDFDPIFNNTEDKLLEEFINRELVKNQIDLKSNLIPTDILKRKNILNIIFSILVFIYISLIFFHFPIYTYVIGIIILFIFFKLTRNYNLIKYLKKEIKARPSEKISNIVMNVKNSFVSDNSKTLRIGCILIAVILPLIIFINPKILYEKVDGGYAVRFYAFGLTNFKTATIPETYKGEKIISLRGNTFSNMPFLETVVLPDSIIEIRGQAFKNDKNLVNVNIPSNLKYLGGGAFYNCQSITSITLPDTLTYLGGEVFYNATSLETIKLSKNLTEIRGDSFKYCTSLKNIEIPDNVTRIGAHAFYGNASLSEVKFTENSKLNEIGSSAFRQCSRLYEIVIPKNVYVNERAFKESPTIVKKFGDVVDSSKYDYTYDTFIYMKFNEKTEINKYKTNAKIQDAYITLISVKKNNSSNEFTLKYTNHNNETTFTLSQNQRYKIFDNIAFEISSDYVLKYDDSISLNVYYN